MAYRIIAKLSVVDEEGNEIDYRGHIGVVGRPFTPLETTQEVKQFDSVKAAHKALNNLFATIRYIGEI